MSFRERPHFRRVVVDSPLGGDLVGFGDVLPAWASCQESTSGGADRRPKPIQNPVRIGIAGSPGSGNTNSTATVGSTGLPTTLKRRIRLRAGRVMRTLGQPDKPCRRTCVRCRASRRFYCVEIHLAESSSAEEIPVLFVLTLPQRAQDRGPRALLPAAFCHALSYSQCWDVHAKLFRLVAFSARHYLDSQGL